MKTPYQPNICGSVRDGRQMEKVYTIEEATDWADLIAPADETREMTLAVEKKIIRNIAIQIIEMISVARDSGDFSVDVGEVWESAKHDNGWNGSHVRELQKEMEGKFREKGYIFRSPTHISWAE